jgi:hypothetical protein
MGLFIVDDLPRSKGEVARPRGRFPEPNFTEMRTNLMVTIRAIFGFLVLG